MADKLTSIKGFGEGDPKPEKKDRKMASWRKEAIKVHGGSDFKRTGNLKADAHRAIGNMSKSSALNKKMGKKSTLGNPSFIKKLEKHKEDRRDYM